MRRFCLQEKLFADFTVWPVFVFQGCRLFSLVVCRRAVIRLFAAQRLAAIKG